MSHNSSKLLSRTLPIILIVIVLVISGVIFNTPKKSSASWYSSGSTWSYRKSITIDHTKITATTTPLLNFPMLFSVTDSDLKYTDSGGFVASSTAGDILFTSSDGTTKLSHEIEYYASTTGQIIAWVKIPSLSPTDDTTIYMYYGSQTTTYQPNPTGVWDSNYKGVWHLPDGTTLSALDSTSNANNGTLSNSPTAVTGQIDGGANFVRASGQSIHGTMTAPGLPITMSALFKLSSLNVYHTFLAFNSGGNDGYELVVNDTNHPEATFGGVADYSFSNLTVTTGQWYYFSITIDQANGTATGYMAKLGDNLTVQSIGVGTPNGTPTQFVIGTQNGQYTDGIVDEVRVSNITRTASWITTEYANQNSPSTFYAYSARQIQNPTLTNYTTTGPSWYSSSWLYRKAITIDHTKVPNTDQTNFPVEIDLTDSNLQANALSNGNDILFTSSDGTTKIPYEREIYTTSTGRLTAWVKVPTVATASDTVIYMYYGNAGASDQQDAVNTWDSNYKGVWHLPDGTSLTANDSTSNANNGTLVNTPTATAGQIDGAGAFVRSSSQYISLPNGGGLNNIQTGSISAWLKTADNLGSIGFVSRQKNGSFTEMKMQTTRINPSLAYLSWSPYGSQVILGSTNIGNGNWHYIVINYASGSHALYIDGVANGTATTVGTMHDDASIPLTPGGGTGDQNNYWLGSIDEFRTSNTNRSADWITTEYNNQSATSTFYTIGAQSQTRPAGTSGVAINNRVASSLGWYASGSTWSYRKPIIIDHNKVTATTTAIASFPILFSVTDSDLKYTGSGGLVASSTAGDIVFTSSDGTTKLSHEIEYYASTTGQIIAWVRIPSLSGVTDTTIYVYYGSNTTTYQPNPTGVWNSNFKGVWHLSDGTILTTNDSTSNANNLTNHSGVVATGQIGGGINLLGGSDYLVTASAVITGSGNMSYSVWFKSNDTGGPKHVFNINDSPVNNQEMTLGFRGGVNVVFYGPWGSPDSPGTTNYRDNAWHLATVVYDGSTKKLYLDGAQYDSQSASVNIASALTYIGAYGSDPTNSSFNYVGYLDEARIVGTNLGADWITTEYANQSSPSTFYSYGARQVNGRQNSSGVSTPATKLRGGVKFR